MKALRVLFAGESWFKHIVTQKGFDSFATSTYEEGAGHFLEMLRAAGHEVTYVPAHRVDPDFPETAEGLRAFDVVILSDVGANTFLLPARTFVRSEVGPNRLEALRAWVADGGALLMVGGYMSFSGIDGRARYGASPLADALPVELLATDDRVEVPEGFAAEVTAEGVDHPVLSGVPVPWPPLLGYNRVTAKPGSVVLARRGDDPILVVGGYGRGRSAAFASDLAPHWAPPDFVGWSGYPTLWLSLLAWLTEGRSD